MDSDLDFMRVTEDVPEICAVLKKWKRKSRRNRKKWLEGDRGWPAKLVETTFTFNGVRYHIDPDDIGLDRGDSWDNGLMERFQCEIRIDLEAAGATDVFNIGFLD